MSWLSAAWNRNRGAIGNFAKNVSPLLAFTPLGLAGTAITAGLGELARPGKNVGDAFKAGASNAAIGAGARGASNILKPLFTPGSSAAGSMASAAAPGSEVGGQVMGAGNGFTAGAHTAGNAVTAGGSGGPSWLSKAFGAAKDNPLVVGQVASGILGARENGAQRDFQHEQFDFQKQQYSDEQRRRDEMARLLGPLFQQMLANRPQVAANPYAPR